MNRPKGTILETADVSVDTLKALSGTEIRLDIDWGNSCSIIHCNCSIEKLGFFIDITPEGLVSGPVFRDFSIEQIDLAVKAHAEIRLLSLILQRRAKLNNK